MNRQLTPYLKDRATKPARDDFSAGKMKREEDLVRRRIGLMMVKTALPNIEERHIFGCPDAAREDSEKRLVTILDIASLLKGLAGMGLCEPADVEHFATLIHQETLPLLQRIKA
jgi:hypothetical protein